MVDAKTGRETMMRQDGGLALMQAKVDREVDLGKPPGISWVEWRASSARAKAANALAEKLTKEAYTKYVSELAAASLKPLYPDQWRVK